MDTGNSALQPIPLNAMPNWLIKSAIHHAISWLPQSHEWNYLLQKHVTRSLDPGAGGFAHKAAACAEKLGIAGAVDFLGKQPRDVVWQLVARARGLVFSSVRDTSGNVVVEAMGLCCPVVCFKHQGVGIITDDSCAFRIAPQDWDSSVAGFANAMLALNADDRLVDSMGKAGRARIINEFTWNGKIAAMLDIYQNVAGRAES